MCAAGRCQVAEVRRLRADLVEHLQIHIHAGLVGDGQQVQNRIGRTSQRHVASQGVTDGLRIDDVSRLHILLHQIHDGHAGVLCQHDSSAGDRRDGTVARKTNADGFAEAVHAVGGIHAGAGAATRAHVLFECTEAFIIDEAGFAGTNSFEHLRKGGLLTVNEATHHRSAGADDGWDVDAAGCHDHARYDFITVRNQYQSVELVSLRHGLHAIRNQLTAWQRILHSFVTHGDTIAYANGRDHNRGSSGHTDTCFYRLGNLVQMHMARYDFTVSGNDAD